MKNISLKNPLRLSFVVIIIVWGQEFVRNIFFVEGTVRLSETPSRFFLYAFIIGVAYILLVHLLMHFSKEKYQEIGLFKRNILKQIGTGALFGLAIFILQTFVMNPVFSALLPKTAEKAIEIGNLLNSLWYLPVLLFLSLFKAGFSEELWRIFVLTRFQKGFGKPGLIAALVLGSILFGIGHLYQGVASAVSIAFVGLFYSLVYLRKRSALEAMTAHATDDVIAILLGFILYYGN